MLGVLIGTYVLLCLTTLRLYSILRANLWLGQHGTAFESLRRQNHPITSREQRDALYAAVGGDFFPLGIKASRITRWQNSMVGHLTGLRRLLLQVVRVLWSFYVYCPVVVILLCAASALQFKSEQFGFVGLAVASLLVLSTWLLTSEAVLSLIKVHSWGRLYHGLDEADTGSTGEFLSTFGLALMIFIAAIAMYDYVASYFPASYSELTDPTWAGRLADSTNFALLSLLQAGDPGGVSGIGKLSILLVRFACTVFDLVVLGMVISVVVAARPEHRSPDTSTPEGRISTLPSSDPDSPEKIDPKRSRTRTRAGALAIGVLAVAGVVAHFLVR